MCLTYMFIFASIFVLSSPQRQRLYEDDICYNNDGVQGICRRLNLCTTGAAAIQAGKHPRICSFDNDTPIVCCPPQEIYQQTSQRPTKPPWGRPNKPTERPGWGFEPQTSRPRPSQPSSQSSSMSAAIRIAKQKCAEYAKSVVVEVDSPILSEGSPSKEIIDHCARIEEPLVVGGQNAMPREYPHMALIGYREKNPEWLCGGSLISERFILSAAHCSNPGRKGPARWAKLGELDTSTELDDALPQIIRITTRYDHPEYNSVTLYNDISLFKLERSVAFNPFIRPLCLATQQDIQWKTAIATGWGHTAWGGMASTTLMKVRLNLVSNEVCNAIYKGSVGRQIPKGILKTSMLCAGDEKGKDTCQGDSGGPLQIPLKEPYCMYELVGLTSFGKSCGNGYPGVYTRISHFLPWIVQKVWSQ